MAEKVAEDIRSGGYVRSRVLNKFSQDGRAGGSRLRVAMDENEDWGCGARG